MRLPIAQAALERRFPAVSARFFLNLTQTEGPGVAISVRTFVDRYQELSAGIEKFGAETPKALELLVSRGVTAAVLAEATALLTTLTQVASPAIPPSLEEQEEELEKAETAMWEWYLEWSQIARVAIKQRALLKELGFLNTRRGGEEEAEVDPAAPTTPATTTPATGTSPATPAATAPVVTPAVAPAVAPVAAAAR